MVKEIMELRSCEVQADGKVQRKIEPPPESGIRCPGGFQPDQLDSMILSWANQ